MLGLGFMIVELYCTLFLGAVFDKKSLAATRKGGYASEIQKWYSVL